LYALAEALLRMGCLFAIYRMWRRGGPVNPQFVMLLMVVYFSMAFLWAAGTFTWGTATRHHMIHQWIVLMLGVPALLEMRSRVGRVHAPAAPAGPPNAPEAGGSGPQPRRAGPSVVGETLSPRRLGSRGWQPRVLRIGEVAPRLLTDGFGRVRRPARE
jgi:hypothetical protein